MISMISNSTLISIMPMLMPGLQRNLINRKRFPRQSRKRGPRIRKRVHPNAKPRHAIASANPHQAESQNNRNPHRFHMLQHAKIKQNDDRNKRPQQQNEFPLRHQIGFASLINQL